MSVAGRVARALAFAGVGLLAAACSKSEDDGAKPLRQLGYAPPPGPATPPAAPSSSTDGTKTAPAFTSYFATLDSGAPASGAVAAPAGRPAAARPPDPDFAAKEAVRSRLNGCFAQANLAAGTSRNISVTFTVIATGRVSRYDISGASSTDGAFYSCIDGIAASTTFPDRTAPAVAGGPPAVAEVRTLVVTAGASAS